MKADIKKSDHVNYMESDEKCSRCRKDITEEYPLRLWAEDPNYMWIYCESCMNEVLQGD